MDTYKFNIAPTDTNFQLPFDLNEKAFTQWLNSLENHPDSVKSKQILLAIQAVNKETDLLIAKKLALLESIYQSITSILEPLKKAILNSALPLSTEELDNTQHIVWIYAELANGFASCITKKSNQTSALTLFYGLQSLITAYIYISEVYQQPFPNFWKQSYLFYGLACKLKIQDLSIAHYSGHSDTVSKAFKYLLALYHCGLDQFRPRDILCIATCMEKHTSLMLIDNKMSPNYAAQYSGFDLNTDTPPIAVSRLKKTAESALRFFSAYNAAANICKNAPQNARGTGIIKSINIANIFQAAKTLSLSQKRKFTRVSDQQIKSGIIGFNNIIGELAKTSSLKPAQLTTLTAVEKFDPRLAGSWKAPNLELVTEGYESLDVMKGMLGQEQLIPKQKKQLNQAKQVFNANNNLYDHDKYIWNNPSSPDQQKPSSLSNSDLDISDSSIKGYKIIFNTDKGHTSRVQIGDIIGIKNKQSIEIGIIRRILQLNEDKLQLGIKLLGLDSELAYISLPKHESIYAWALFLPGIKALDTADSIIFNDSKFQCGEFVNLYRADQEAVPCRLRKLLNLSSAASHIELFNSNIIGEA